MPGPLAVIGVDAAEIRWIKTLLSLLRHPDPSVPELARQALLYLNDDAAKRKDSAPDSSNGRDGANDSEADLVS